MLTEDLLGIVGLIVLVVSFLQNNKKNIHLVGIFSNIIYLFQALLLNSFSLILTDVFIIVIHIIELIKVKRLNK